MQYLPSFPCSCAQEVCSIYPLTRVPVHRMYAVFTLFPVFLYTGSMQYLPSYSCSCTHEVCNIYPLGRVPVTGSVQYLPSCPFSGTQEVCSIYPLAHVPVYRKCAVFTLFPVFQYTGNVLYFCLALHSVYIEREREQKKKL